MREGPSHLVHAIVTLLLCGLWLPIWIIASLQYYPWRCCTCGTNPHENQPENQPKKAASSTVPDWRVAILERCWKRGHDWLFKPNKIAPLDFKFTCPHCQQPLVVDRSEMGIIIDCPHCRAEMQIPS